VGATAAQAGSVPGGSTVGSGTTPGTGGSIAGLALASHVEMAAFPWRWVVLAGGLLVLGAGVLVAWRGARWPVMSSRYDQPASQAPAAADPASLWESLSQGLDPTESATTTAGSGTVSRSSGTGSGGHGTGQTGVPG
jgi:hypothetical protein